MVEIKSRLGSAAVQAIFLFSIVGIVHCQTCDQTQSAECHDLAGCDPVTGCACPPGMYGDGHHCETEAATIRISFQLTGAVERNWDTRQNLFALVDQLFNDTSGLPPYHQDSFTYSVTGDIISMAIIYQDLNATDEALSYIKPEVMSGELTLDSTTIFYDGTVPIHFDSTGGPFQDGRLSVEPRQYAWVTGTPLDPIPIKATGLEVDRVFFNAGCKISGCWVIDVTYSTGENNFNVFYLPRSDNDDTLSYDFDYTGTSLDATYLPRNFPCGNNNYDPTFGMGGIPSTVSACCIPAFKDLYRPVGTFESETFGDGNPDLDTLRGMCSTSGPPTISSTTQPASHLEGLFSDTDAAGNRLYQVNTSEVISTGVVDPYLGIYTATFYLDEHELRRYMSKMAGTVSVEYSLDTFVGLAEFKPANGLQYIDMAATQIAIRLERTNFFTVSTHGTNDYTFLNYVNLRLVEVYMEDADHTDDAWADRLVRTNRTVRAQYIQVTFTLDEQYATKDAAYDLIPLDSVLVGKGTFATEASFEHACLDYAGSAQYTSLFSSADEAAQFDEYIGQACGPEAAMCQNPADIPDSFVAFNVPVGFNWLPEASGDLSGQVYVNFVIQAANPEALPGGSEAAPDASQITKTTLRASIPVVKGGINAFCDAVTAKTDLKDVAKAVIVLGSAATAAELTRLRMEGEGEGESITTSRMSPREPTAVDSASIEGGLITLVLQGNRSYFSAGDSNEARGDFGLELEDVLTIHIMEAVPGFDAPDSHAGRVLELIRAPPDEQYDAESALRTEGYLLNGAFFMQILRDEARARLEPSSALLRFCGWAAARPQIPIEANCILRREVSGRNNYPVRNGLPGPMAMELPHCDPAVPDCDATLPATSAGAGAGGEADDVEEFMGMVLGESEYAQNLGRAYAGVLARRFELNNVYNRAYWINPGYEWAGAQAGAQSGAGARFQLSQKIFLFALIALNENRLGTLNDVGGEQGQQEQEEQQRRRKQPRRRALLQAASGEEPEAMAEGLFEYDITPERLIADAVGLPAEQIATFEVRTRLTEAQACLPDIQLMAELREVLEGHFAKVASAHRTVQLSFLHVDAVEDICGDSSRRSAARRGLLQASLEQYTNAVATVRAMVAFEDAKPQISRKTFLNLPGVVGIEVLSGPEVAETDDLVAQPPEAEDQDGSGWKVKDPGLLAGGIGVGLCVVAIIAGTYIVRKKNQELLKAEASEAKELEEGNRGDGVVGEEVGEGEAGRTDVIKPAVAAQKAKVRMKEKEGKDMGDVKTHLHSQLAVQYDSD